MTKSSGQKNRNGVRQLSSTLITASPLIIVLYAEHGIHEKPFILECLKSLNSSMYTARVSRERAQSPAQPRVVLTHQTTLRV